MDCWTASVPDPSSLFPPSQIDSADKLALLLRVLEEQRRLQQEARVAREEERRLSEVQLAILRELRAASPNGGDGVKANPADFKTSTQNSTTTSTIFDFNGVTMDVAASLSSGSLATPSVFSSPVFESPVMASASSAASIQLDIDAALDASMHFAQQAQVPLGTYSPAQSFISENDNTGFEFLFESLGAFEQQQQQQSAEASVNNIMSELLQSVAFPESLSSHAVALAPAPVVATPSVATKKATVRRPAAKRTTSTQKSTSPTPSATSTSTSAPVIELPMISSVYKESMSGSKKIVEHPCNCLACGIPVATAVLRGVPSAFQEKPYVFEAYCESCDPSGSVPAPGDDLKILPSRKRARGRSEKILNCDVCRRNVGSGGVKIDSSACESNKRVKVSADGAVALSEDSKAGYSVEIVCASCRCKYAFCTECGGGGKYRTGKYRPVELFPANRRTCSLSHARVGDVSVSHRVYSMLTSPHITEQLLADTRSIFADAITSLLANPKSMETPTSRYNSVARIQAAIDYAWESLTREMRDAPAAERERNVVRYLATSFIPKVPRKKSRAKSAQQQDSGAKRGRSASISDEKDNTTTNNVDMLDADMVPVPSATDFAETAFMTAEWARDRGTLLVTQLGARMMAMQSATITKDLLVQTLRRAQRDREEVMMQQPGVWVPKVEHAWFIVAAGEPMMTAFAEKLGAVPESVYVRDRNVGTGEGLFVLRPEDQPGDGVDFVVYAISGRELLDC
ncbi:hypothetical protein HDU76_006801 [Blyttiomyces sp. JEL0837]|nr:hypothetical protein HDU76_006801 [Blyttiomyces sp. JEL0837]